MTRQARPGSCSWPTRPLWLAVLAGFVLLLGSSAPARGGGAHGEAERVAPSAEELFVRLNRLATATTWELDAEIRALWAGREIRREVSFVGKPPTRALVKVRGPQREAGRALLRIGDVTLSYDPAWGRVERIGSTAQRDPWASTLVASLDWTYLGSFEDRYESAGVVPMIYSRGSAWVLKLTAKPGSSARCRALEVGFHMGGGWLMAGRCERPDGVIEQWTFDDVRPVAGRMFPTRIQLEAPGTIASRVDIRLKRVEADMPLGDSRFTMTALTTRE